MKEISQCICLLLSISWNISPQYIIQEEKNILIMYPKINRQGDYQAYIDQMIAKEKAQYLQEYHTGNCLRIFYDEYVSDKYCSFLFYIMKDFQGAHPLTTLSTINFTDAGIVDKNEVIDDLGLSLISEYTYQTLKAELKEKNMYVEDMLKQGTAPVYENFENMILLTEGYLFFFEPYQVAPYAAGISTVYLSKLKADASSHEKKQK